MANYTKSLPPLVISDDDDGKSIIFYRQRLADNTMVNQCRVDLPGLGPDDATIAELWPLAADRAALAALLAKGVKASLARRGLTVVP